MLPCEPAEAFDPGDINYEEIGELCESKRIERRVTMSLRKVPEAQRLQLIFAPFLAWR
jgi:hypothetical protein